MARGKKAFAEDGQRQTSALAEKDFADVLEEQQRNDDMLVAAGSDLARIGKRLVDLGATLERPETIPPSLEPKELEDLVAQIPALVSRYHEHCAKKLEIQAQLTNLSWHRS